MVRVTEGSFKYLDYFEIYPSFVDVKSSSPVASVSEAIEKQSQEQTKPSPISQARLEVLALGLQVSFPYHLFFTTAKEESLL